ncbi:MAG: hypothetical protein HW404_1542, partial [Anaerolineales bacterium]|nr:hypothetical protein [Anaerolineales bacterium]
VFTVALGVAVLHESLAPVQAVGGALVLTAAILVASRHARAARAVPTA